MLDMKHEIAHELDDIDLTMKKNKKNKTISSDGWAKSLCIHLEMKRCSDQPDAAEPASTSAPLFYAV